MFELYDEVVIIKTQRPAVIIDICKSGTYILETIDDDTDNEKIVDFFYDGDFESKDKNKRWFIVNYLLFLLIMQKAI